MENIPQNPAPTPQPEQSKIKISGKILAIIILTIIAIAVSYIYMQRPPQTYLSQKVQNSNNQKTPETNSGFKTYTNEEYGFEFQYPASVEAGQKSKSSVLGTADKDVPGFYVAQYVFVYNSSAALTKQMNSYYQTFLNAALHPTPTIVNQDGPGGLGCESIPVANKDASVSLVSCHGAGGGLTLYGMITKAGKQIFVDGASGGWSVDYKTPGRIIEQSELIQILSTFKFTK